MKNFTIGFRPGSEGYSWENLDVDWWRIFVAHNFYKFIPIIGILYLGGIYFGQKFMKNRSPLTVTRSLVIWNAILAVFSTICAYKGYLEILHDLNNHGIYTTFCERILLGKSGSFWGIAFLFSKIFELGDTVFLVVKKKKVIFLHWFHHFAVLNTAFYIFPKFEPAIISGGTINAGVHSVMYTYYSLMAAGVKVPKLIAMAITAIQITQFIIGLNIISYAVYKRVSGVGCLLSNETIFYGAAQISIYFVLFTKIFFETFISLLKVATAKTSATKTTKKRRKFKRK